MDQQPEPNDDFHEAQVERALKPYRGMLPQEQLAQLEALVRDLLQNDPVAAELLQAARPRTAPATSGEKEVAGAPLGARDRPAGKGER